jgi:hypothetical protein
MLTTTQVDGELLALLEFVETDLLPPYLHRRLGHFPEHQLKIALRDILDWLSLRGILRGRTASLSGRVHPLAGRIVASLPALSQYLCVPDGVLEFRVEVPLESREEIEDFVKERIWHRRATCRRNGSRETLARDPIEELIVIR